MKQFFKFLLFVLGIIFVVNLFKSLNNYSKNVKKVFDNLKKLLNSFDDVKLKIEDFKNPTQKELITVAKNFLSPYLSSLSQLVKDSSDIQSESTMLKPSVENVSKNFKKSIKIKSKLANNIKVSGLTKRQHDILEFITSKSVPVGMQEISGTFKNITERTLRRDLSFLEVKDLVKKQGKTKSVRYLKK